ncbi:phosphopantetheine-binding protein [Halorhodospira neutriphila]|uniref:phosphopantetheine-binding protein n=1 Tax=Halorhodospira neutriphila TaxID=168379 RepID=UPI001907F65A
MTEESDEQIDGALRQALAEIAPEADTAALDPQRSFHAQLEIDSIDFLRLMDALERALGLQIPDVEYHHLATPGSCRAYLHRRPGRLRCRVSPPGPPPLPPRRSGRRGPP